MYPTTHQWNNPVEHTETLIRRVKEDLAPEYLIYYFYGRYSGRVHHTM